MTDILEFYKKNFRGFHLLALGAGGGGLAVVGKIVGGDAILGS